MKASSANEYQNLIMLRRDMKNIPEFKLPSGTSFSPIEKGNACLWTEIWREVEPEGSIKDELFHKEFGEDWELIGKHCFLFFDKAGKSLGTISSWFADSFKAGPGKWGRLHWVALRKDYHGKGLAKPMISLALQEMSRHYEQSYLVTQYYRIPAIKLYLDFGFEPYIDSKEACEAWEASAEKLIHPVIEESIKAFKTRV